MLNHISWKKNLCRGRYSTLNLGIAIKIKSTASLYSTGFNWGLEREVILEEIVIKNPKI